MAKRGRVVLLHFVAQMPMAGIAWQALQYLVGLERLGFEAWYVENHGTNPYDPRISSVVTECDYNVAYLKETLERHGLAGRWAYWDAINDVYHGMSRERVFDLLKGADALINLCGSTRLRDEHMACPVRIMVDTDPVYEQIKYAKADPAARAYLDAHTHFFTYGENVGGPGWIVPLCGVPWKPTRPPVVLDLWPVAEGQPDCFSTIATWENKGKNIEFEGESYVGRSMSIFCASSISRSKPGNASRWRCCRPRPTSKPWSQEKAGSWSIRARSRHRSMLTAISSAARAASLRLPKTSMLDTRAGGSAIAASVISPRAGLS